MPGLNQELVAHVATSGFEPLESLVHLFVGGSELHGAKCGRRPATIGAMGQMMSTSRFTLFVNGR